MSWRFRRTTSVLPGVRVNFNKHSTSVSIGGRGARVTVSSRGRKTTSLGARGTGLHAVDRGKGFNAQVRGRTSAKAPLQFNGTHRSAAVRAGVRGAGVTQSTRGTRGAVGLPGSGLSAAQEYPGQPPAPPPRKPQSGNGDWIWTALLCLIIARVAMKMLGVG